MSQMIHNTLFFNAELNAIRKLLRKRSRGELDSASLGRLLRNRYGFYVSDFPYSGTYDVEDLERELEEGKRVRIPVECEYNYFTGQPRQFFCSLNRSVSQYLTHYRNMKVGITASPERRFRQHLRNNPEKMWQRMVVVYMTNSKRNANKVEARFIKVRKPEFVNIWEGYSHMTKSGPYYVYFLLGDRIN